MSTPKAGKHITLRPNGEERFLVELVQKYPGEKKRVYYRDAQGERQCVYTKQCKALPRCKVCDSEGHPTPKLDKNGDPRPCPSGPSVSTPTAQPSSQ